MGPGGFGPPPRKKSPLVPILLGGGGGLVLLIFIIIVIAAVSNSGDSSSSSSSYSYSYSSYSFSSFSYSASSFSTSALPTSSESSSSDTSGGGYGPPESNKIYRTAKMKGVHCTANLTSTSSGPYRRYVKKVSACLDKAWAQVFASQNMEFRKPDFVVSNSKNPSSPCSSSANIGYVPIAFYCSTNETMYFSIPGAQRYGIRYRDYLVMTAAHEYGHHIQTLYGLWPYYEQRYNSAYPNVSKYTRINRRMELQPQCFAGMFLGRNSGGMHLSAGAQKNNAGHVGDNAVQGWRTHPQYRTHGQYRNSRYWFSHGWDTGRAGTCNTWSASGSLVA